MKADKKRIKQLKEVAKCYFNKFVSLHPCSTSRNLSIPRNDFDWSEVSMAPGDGWGEYVEEYEAALCVSLDIDHGFRWDTR